MADNFWLNDAQWAVIAPRLPMVHTGPEREDDRRVISGILHRLREGCRWRALPDECGPYTVVFNRYNRWSKRGLWQRIFAALVECGGPGFGQNQARLRHLGLQRLQPLFHVLQVVALPHATHAERRDRHVFLSQFVRHPHMAPGRLLQRQADHGLFDLRDLSVP